MASLSNRVSYIFFQPSFVRSALSLPTSRLATSWATLVPHTNVDWRVSPKSCYPNADHLAIWQRNRHSPFCCLALNFCLILCSLCVCMGGLIRFLIIIIFLLLILKYQKKLYYGNLMFTVRKPKLSVLKFDNFDFISKNSKSEFKLRAYSTERKKSTATATVTSTWTRELKRDSECALCRFPIGVPIRNLALELKPQWMKCSIVTGKEGEKLRMR